MTRDVYRYSANERWEQLMVGLEVVHEESEPQNAEMVVTS